VDWDTVKTGRKITGLIFVFQKRKNGPEQADNVKK
jgi:plasmid replication initiation protein